MSDVLEKMAKELIAGNEAEVKRLTQEAIDGGAVARDVLDNGLLAGMDVVRLASQGAIAQGTRQYGVLFDDDGDEGPRKSRMFLFDSVETRNQFESDPDQFLKPVMQAMRDGQLDRLVR